MVDILVYPAKPYPKIKVARIKMQPTMYVTLFKPFSADFWEENNWLAEPIAAMPSPFGECKSTNIIKRTPVIICMIKKKLVIVFPLNFNR